MEIWLQIRLSMWKTLKELSYNIKKAYSVMIIIIGNGTLETGVQTLDKAVCILHNISTFPQRYESNHSPQQTK